MNYYDETDLVARVNADIHYHERHQPLAKFAEQLGEAIGDDPCEILALHIRNGDAPAVLDHLRTIYRSYMTPLLLDIAKRQQELL